MRYWTLDAIEGRGIDGYADQPKEKYEPPKLTPLGNLRDVLGQSGSGPLMPPIDER